MKERGGFFVAGDGSSRDIELVVELAVDSPPLIFKIFSKIISRHNKIVLSHQVMVAAG